MSCPSCFWMTTVKEMLWQQQRNGATWVVERRVHVHHLPGAPPSRPAPPGPSFTAPGAMKMGTRV